MLFNSLSFLIFFPIVVLLYFAVPKKYRYIWLLVASYYFYMSWNAKYGLLLLFSTAATYLASMMIEKKREHKKLWLVFCVVVNIGILGIFKYLDFALENINAVLNAFHVEAINPAFDIVLPVGISFYTFQALSYTIDVYRGDIKAEKNFARYALFVSFFPQLVAGPIERSGNLLKQLQESTDFNYENAKNGLITMIWGFFEKLVIADRAAVIVNEVYNNYESYPFAMYVFATVLFAFQLYGDFSGYSHIAIGAAKVMGYDLMENFRQPYFSVSIKDFWSRWHISMSTWFRDYIYFSLGGSRCSKLRQNINLMITFTLSGLWHGARWNYVIWGALHGVYQVVGNLTGKARSSLRKKCHIKDNCLSYRLFQMMITFALHCFSCFVFRIDSFAMGGEMIKKAGVNLGIGWFFDGGVYSAGLSQGKVWLLLFSIVLLLLIDLIHEKKWSIRSFINKQDIVFRWFCYLAATIGLLIIVLQDYGVGAANFIYFQF